MLSILKNPAQIVTVNTEGTNVKIGKEASELSVLENHSVIIEDGFIKDFISNSKVSKKSFDNIIDVTNKTILPGLVECHTHTAFAGSRAEEFREKLAGVDYEDIAKRGGGINSTVKSVREASFDDLVNLMKPRIDYFISQGITTLEIKSGYGLSYYDEVKLLQVINHCNKIFQIDIIPTFLGAHTFPPEYKNDPDKYIDIITNEMLPFIAENNLAIFCDAFCEVTAFSAEQVDKIFTKAVSFGLKTKLHTEQFNSIGGLEVGLKHNSVSVDHLEVLPEDKIELLKSSSAISVLLPGVSFFLDYDFAPARKLIDNNCPVALSTDYNPGSSHIANLNIIMSLAALKSKMNIEEIISAVTINAAKAVSVENEAGSLEINKKADFSVYNTKEYSDIVYNVGKNMNCMTIKNGEVIYKN